MPLQARGMAEELQNVLTGEKSSRQLTSRLNGERSLQNANKILGLDGESLSNDDDVDWRFGR